ncbi:MAG: hypothetical protein NTY02_00835 [Acidobacteria bacterium]|nr:hypothetical protein [Acidobacteriota bacterium]
MHDVTYSPPASLDRLRQRSLLVGVVGLAAAGAGAFLNPGQFFHSYLLAFLLWLAAALGGLALSMLHHLSGGGWGVVLRRIFEASARTLPWMALFFVPIAFGVKDLYPWTDTAMVAADHVLKEKAAYLNVPFFLVRAAIYFVIWCGLAYFLSRWSAEQDATGNPAFAVRMQRLSAGGLVIYVLTMTFASIDWGMSLEPHWFSTMYGFLFVIGQALMGLSVAIIMARRLSAEPPMSGVYTTRHFHDFGKLLFAFTMVWAYLTFSQFLIIWSANLPEEIPWYQHRMDHGWEYIGLMLVALHFAVPFVVLLSSRMKRNATVLARMAMWLIVMRFLDLFYLIGPEAYPKGLGFHWLDVAAVVGLGGIWIGLFTSNLKSRSLLPVNDPGFEDALHKWGQV